MCDHDNWRLVETGYIRMWSTEIDPVNKSIVAFYGGSSDFSEIGNQDDHLMCSTCLVTKPIPQDWTVDFA